MFDWWKELEANFSALSKVQLKCADLQEIALVFAKVRSLCVVGFLCLDIQIQLIRWKCLFFFQKIMLELWNTYTNKASNKQVCSIEGPEHYIFYTIKCSESWKSSWPIRAYPGISNGWYMFHMYFICVLTILSIHLFLTRMAMNWGVSHSWTDPYEWDFEIKIDPTNCWLHSHI